MVRTALVQTYHRYTQFTHVHPLGIMMIASAARECGHEDLHLLDMKVEDWTPEQACDELEKLAPDVVGLSAMTYEAGCLHEVAKEIKRRRPETIVVAGGPHPSVAAEDVLEDPAVDFVVRGEGEYSFAAVLDGIAEGRTDWSDCEGISYRDADGVIQNNPDRPPPMDLDTMPFPAWDLIDHEKYHTVPRGGVIYAHKEFATMFSSRACP
ncbi:MAG: cobalamin-dependent protein, partial [Planctomycetota bacterium]